MPEIKETIDGQEILFQPLGAATILAATKRVREVKMGPCRDTMASLSGSSLEVIVGQVNAAIEAVMRHMVPSRQDIFDWLQTDEGAIFMIEESLKKAKSKLNALELYDKMDLDQIDRVQSSLLGTIVRRPETDKAINELVNKIVAEQIRPVQVQPHDQPVGLIVRTELHRATE